MEVSFVEPAQRERTADTAVRSLRRRLTLIFGVALWAAVLAAIVAAVGIGLLPRLGMYRTLTVLSASMKPTFSPGDVVVVRPEPIQDLRVGQIISYQVPVGVHQVETHRVVRILRGRGTTSPVIQTKGDNNTVVDPWTARLDGTTVYRLEAVVPKAGYAIGFMRGHLFHLISVVLIPALLAIFAIASMWGIGRRKPTQDAPA
jgi:signal peptidase